MAGRNFLDVARAVLSGQSEYYWRAAIVHAYYALFLECRDALFAWGQRPAQGQNVHAWTRLKMVYSSSADLKRIADALDKLVRLRNKASYDLSPSPLFTSVATAQNAIQTADQALALLDQIQADPQRRQAAIASLPP
jgi:uncharacterized protein (UPF0332 family)